MRAPWRCWRHWLLAAVAALALAGCARDPQPVLRIGTNVWIGSEPLYLARDLGHFESASVQLVEYPSASEVMRAYRNEAIDGMVLSLDELFGLAADGLQPRVILVIDVSHGADAIVARPGVKSLHDLQGKPIAVESSALGAFVLSRALAINHMQPGDLKVVHLESNEQPGAFERGQVDAAVTFDPYRAQMVRAGAVTLFDSRQMPGEIVDVVAVRESALTHHARCIDALLGGWFAALDYLRSNPDDAARRMGVRQQASAAQVLQGLQGLRLPTREENLRMLGGEKPELAVTGSRLGSLMLQARLLRAEPDIGRMLAPEPLAKLRR